jgi:hypothetical protein
MLTETSLPGDLSADDLRVLLAGLRRDYHYQGARERRRVEVSGESMIRRRHAAAGMEAVEWGLLALERRPEALIRKARSAGATSRGIGRLRSILSGDPTRAARGLYERLAVSCDRCANTGHTESGRCRCFRGQVVPAYRCASCHDSGMVLGADGASPCDCRPTTPRRWTNSVLITEALVWALAGKSRVPVELFLEHCPAMVKRGVVLWLAGGQERPTAGLAADRYAGYGVARLCADRIQSVGIAVRRVTPLELLEEARRGEIWFEDGTAVLFDRPETALPTRELRGAIELLLSSASDWCGSVVIATELAPEAPLSGRPSWRAFVERALGSVDPAAWRTLREGLNGDPACPMLGEVHPLMLSSPACADYLTERSRSLLARMAPADQASLAAAA